MSNNMGELLLGCSAWNHQNNFVPSIGKCTSTFSKIITLVWNQQMQQHILAH